MSVNKHRNLVPTEQAQATLDALSIREVGEFDDSATFTANGQWQPQGRLFGGQVLAQSILASAKTVVKTRSLHSLHAYFLRPGSLDQSLHLAVTNLRDGKSFSARRVEVTQDKGAIFSMTASFQSDERGFTHQVTMPEGIPMPEELESDLSDATRVGHTRSREQILNRPFEVKHIEPRIYDSAEETPRRDQAVWFRFPLDVGNEPVINQALLAYSSDIALLEPTLRNQGISWASKNLMVASIDHSMWFHRHVKVNEWLLHYQSSTSAQGARGLSEGHIFTREGDLVATMAQEGLFRATAT